jgi:hypothetical protein
MAAAASPCWPGRPWTSFERAAGGDAGHLGGGLIALDRDNRRVLVLRAASATADVVGAPVVICARRTQQSVVTSDPGDLRSLDPQISLVTV